MDDAIEVLLEINESSWSQLAKSLEDVEDDEAHWRPLPEANSIALIVRHLRIEAEWHLDSLERDEPMPTILVTPSQAAIDKISFDFQENRRALERLAARFNEVLRRTSLAEVRQRTAAAYGEDGQKTRPHFIAYHQATHLAVHCGQIRTIRNLYRKTRGEPARFFPENPTYPRR